MAHRYYVEWSAPNHRDAGSTVVLADDKPAAIRRARTKLGAKVKSRHLSHFNAWRVVSNRSPHRTTVRTFPQLATHRAVRVRT